MQNMSFTRCIDVLHANGRKRGKIRGLDAATAREVWARGDAEKLQALNKSLRKQRKVPVKPKNNFRREISEA